MAGWIAGLCFAAAIGGGALFAASLAAAPDPGSTRTVQVTIPAGDRTSQIAHLLAARGVVRSALAMELSAILNGQSGRLQAGTYALRPDMTLAQVLTKLTTGRVVSYRVTIPEGWDVQQIATRLAQARLGSADAFLAAAQDRSLLDGITSPGPEVRYALEGYLYPDTYEFTRSMTPKQILGTMVARFRAVWSPRMTASARRLGLSVSQAVTLASIVAREAYTAADGPVVAGVYLNRLRRGMPLESNPTVLYAVGRTSGSLSRADLGSASPYNTYVHPGLPPGPIANPGVASLRAAVNPASVPYLYFISTPTGRLVFSATLAQQIANENRYLAG